MEEYEVCTDYAAGAFEQARNVSRLTGTKITVLDPRYSPTGGMLKKDFTKLLCYDEAAADGEGDWVNCGYTAATFRGHTPIPRTSATRPATLSPTRPATTRWSPSRPARCRWTCTTAAASNFGDDYDEQDVCLEDDDPWYPSATCATDEIDFRWDWLENGADLATEASVYGNPSGDRFYAVWNQELPIGATTTRSTPTWTAEFRRIFYN